MGGAWCRRALPHPRGHTPARVAPHLCATLPFLMSEMIRGSPRFLLAAVEQGRQAVNLILKAPLFKVGSGEDTVGSWSPYFLAGWL